MRILLAEDEKDLNKIITARLKDEYYSVDSCFDGKEAEEYLTAVKYDAVILDIMMPKKDGLSVLKEMRRKKDSTLQKTVWKIGWQGLTQVQMIIL